MQLAVPKWKIDLHSPALTSRHLSPRTPSCCHTNGGNPNNADSTMTAQSSNAIGHRYHWHHTTSAFLVFPETSPSPPPSAKFGGSQVPFPVGRQIKSRRRSPPPLHGSARVCSVNTAAPCATGNTSASSTSPGEEATGVLGAIGIGLQFASGKYHRVMCASRFFPFSCGPTRQ